LPEHGVDEGRFAVVDVGDDGDVANVLRHGAYVSTSCPAPRAELQPNSLEHRRKPVLPYADKNSCWCNQQPGRISLDSQVRSSKYKCSRDEDCCGIPLIRRHAGNLARLFDDNAVRPFH
jgi:hypothetical protein